MGILQRIWSVSSPEERLLASLADITGRHRDLAGRLARHAELCAYPNIAEGLRALAVKTEERARALEEILRERHTWSKMPGASEDDGSSNWQRVTGDLALLLQISREMNQQVLKWESIDAALAARLRTIALADDVSLGQLRELGLKCDPQALD